MQLNVSYHITYSSTQTCVLGSLQCGW